MTDFPFSFQMRNYLSQKFTLAAAPEILQILFPFSLVLPVFRCTHSIFYHLLSILNPPAHMVCSMSSHISYIKENNQINLNKSYWTLKILNEAEKVPLSLCLIQCIIFFSIYLSYNFGLFFLCSIFSPKIKSTQPSPTNSIIYISQHK